MQIAVEGRKTGVCFAKIGRFVVRINGSITVEASIIVPIVILSIAAAIYAGLLLYQRELVHTAASMASEAGAACWASGTAELVTGKPAREGSEEFRLYRRLYDSNKESRLEAIEQYALSLAARNELVKPVESSAEATVKDYAVYRRLEVSISKKYNLPVGKFLKLFGGSDSIVISVKSVSTINEPVELIRTTDFIVDFERKLEDKFPGMKKLGEKTRKAMNDIKDKIGEFTD